MRVAVLSALPGDIFIAPDKLAKKLEVDLGEPVRNSLATRRGAEVAYLDEVAVIAGLRRQGIATELVRRVLSDLARSGTRDLVARTKAEPPTELYGWFLHNGQEVTSSYEDGSNRVILAGSIEPFVQISKGLER